jgi:hypothetical protein
MLLIQGIFFQDRTVLGIDTAPIVGEVVLVRNDILPWLFSGVIAPGSTHFPRVTDGFIRDRFGLASISKFSLSEKRLKFTKKYEGRDDLIAYEFKKKEGNEWLGTYTGEATGNGYASCTLVKVADSFLSPHRFKNFSMPK